MRKFYYYKISSFKTLMKYPHVYDCKKGEYYDELLPFIEDKEKLTEVKNKHDGTLLWETLEEQYTKIKEADKHRTEVRHKRNKCKEHYNVNPKELNKIIKILEIQYLKSLGVSTKIICEILGINKSTVSRYNKIEYDGKLRLGENIKSDLRSKLESFSK